MERISHIYAYSLMKCDRTDDISLLPGRVVIYIELPCLLNANDSEILNDQSICMCTK